MTRSTRPTTRPALTVRVLALAALSHVLLACASQGATASNPARGSATGAALASSRNAPVRAPRDTASVAIGDAKSVERFFTGRFPGVNVQVAADGGLQIRIRGASEEPLYVVDGTPLPWGTGEISLVNPYDIERIQVLKNPADVAVYGGRAANGVILIATIRPGRR